MRRTAVAAAATVLTCTAAAAGCGVGPGESAEGQATLTVTRDYGAESLRTATLDGPTPSDSVVRFLDANADIDTDYGDNFVSTIDGLEGSTVNGGDEDWFFFVNGIYSEIGAGEAHVNPGDRIWWDYRRWSEAYRVPAVVGSWPEPFLSGYDGEVRPVVVECLADQPAPCDTVAESLRDAGAEPEVEDVDEPVEHADELRILVGPWERLRDDQAARQLESGPAVSGVYAEVEACREGWALSILSSDARPRLTMNDGGLVAAVRQGEDEPTWVVTAGSEDDLGAAAALVGEEGLRDRYAVASGAGGEALPVPSPEDDPMVEGESCP